MDSVNELGSYDRIDSELNGYDCFAYWWLNWLVFELGLRREICLMYSVIGWDLLYGNIGGFKPMQNVSCLGSDYD